MSEVGSEIELPLLDVVINQPDDISKTAIELFGNQYECLVDKIKYKEKLETYIVSIPITLFILFPLFFITGIQINNFNLVWVALAFLSASYVTLFLPMMAYSYKKVAKDFFDEADYIVTFFNTFENFKLGPEEYKVAKLFRLFKELNGMWIVHIQDGQLLEQDQLEFFGSLGEIFLMDAICRTLGEKNEHSLVKKWNDIKKLNPISQPYRTFWIDMGLAIPTINAHVKFNYLVDSTDNAVNISTKINDLFLEALTRGIELKYI